MAVAIGAFALVSMPTIAAAKPKAKLVAKGLKVVSSPAASINPALPVVILESDRRGRFSVEYTIKNVGRAPSNTKHAGIYSGATKVASQKVGPLNKREARTFTKTLNPRFGSAGAYDAQVCITRNCSSAVDFTAVPRRWFVDKFETGPNTFAGGAPFFSGHAEQIVFNFHGMVVHGGEPNLMWLATGSMFGETSGEADGCRYSGTGQVAHSPWGWTTGPDWGYLAMTPELDRYFAQIKADEAGYGGFRSCENPDFGGEYTGSFWPLETLDSTQGSVYQTTYPTATQLVGNYVIYTGYGSGNATGEWSFRADIP